MRRELLSFRLQHLCQVDLLGVGPQPLQIIELPGFVGEHMDHHVGKVHQQPGAAPVAFNVVGLLAMLTSMVVGILVGTIAGLFGGIVDAILMRFVDVLSSIPWIVLVTVVSILLKPGITSIILVIGLFSWMEIARLVRAETQSIRGHDFVQYAELCGVSRLSVIVRHVIPSAFPTIITAATTSLASAIMTESSLSFLGVGVQQPMSSWGSLLKAAQGYMQNNIYMAFIPGLLIVIVIFAFNKLGNVLRVFADPQVMSGERG